MATKLEKPLKRVIQIHGIESPVIVILDQEGIQMCIPGHKKKVFSSWFRVASQMETPPNSLSYLEGRPIEFLKQQVAAKKKKENTAAEGSKFLQE